MEDKIQSTCLLTPVSYMLSPREDDGSLSSYSLKNWTSVRSVFTSVYLFNFKTASLSSSKDTVYHESASSSTQSQEQDNRRSNRQQTHSVHSIL